MRIRTTIPAAALLLALTACGTGDLGNEPAPATDASTPAAETPASRDVTNDDAPGLDKAVKAYTVAYFKPDATTAYEMLSKRCAEKIDKAVYAATIKRAADRYGPHTAVNIEVDQAEGDLARVSYQVDGVPELAQDAQPWVREDHAWRYDAC